MSIVVRRGQAIAEPRARLLRFDRSTSVCVLAATSDINGQGLAPGHELREASISLTRAAVELGLPAGSVRVAYAIRWLELGDGRARPAWGTFVAGPVELVLNAVRAGVASAGDQRNGEITT